MVHSTGEYKSIQESRDKFKGLSELFKKLESGAAPSAPDHIISELIRVTSERGLNPSSFLVEAGIDLSNLDGLSVEKDGEKLSRYIYNLWKALGDEGGGFTGAPIPLGAYLMMGRLTVHQPTLRKAIELGFRFYGMVTKAYRAVLKESNGTAFFEFELLPVPSQKDPYHIFTELLMMSWHRFSCFLLDQHIPLIDIYFNYDVPVHVSHYSLAFPGRHIFNSDKLGFSFPASYLDKETVQNDFSVKEFLSGSPMSFFRRYHSDESMNGRIIKMLRPLVCSGLPNIEEVAAKLNLTSRTLNRKLKAECTSYQRLKDIVRRDEAISLLTENELPINKVSELINFSEPAVFSRAFLSWTGESPAQFRAKVKKNK